MTGCIPATLREVPDNDLDELGLPFCSPPEAPAISAVTPGGGFLIVSWTPPGQTAGSAVTAYDLRHIQTAADETVDSIWTVLEEVWTATPGGDLEYTITGLTGETQYDVQVRAVNRAGPSPWSETSTGTPKPSSVCVTGGAVVDATNIGLVLDCEALLSARDTLAGISTLNWSPDTAITEWEGITVRGTPARVAWLDLRDVGLNGSVPAELGQLSNLSYLNLRANDLTISTAEASQKWLVMDLRTLTRLVKLPIITIRYRSVINNNGRRKHESWQATGNSGSRLRANTPYRRDLSACDRAELGKMDSGLPPTTG